MKISDSTKVIHSYQTKPVNWMEAQEYKRIFPHISYNEISDLVDQLDVEGISIDLNKSRANFSGSSGIIDLKLTEPLHVNEALQYIILNDGDMEIKLSNYHKSSDASMTGGSVSHSRGVVAELSYSGEDYNTGRSMIDKAKGVISNFYSAKFEKNLMAREWNL